MFLTEEQKVLQKVLRRAKKDDAFKQALIADPIAAIQEETGVEVNVPEGRTLIVEDQTDPNIIYVNIPPKNSGTDVEDVELTEEQLEMVAGGRSISRPAVFNPGQIVCFPTQPTRGKSAPSIGTSSFNDSVSF